jgi:hypothetical protein
MTDFNENADVDSIIERLLDGMFSQTFISYDSEHTITLWRAVLFFPLHSMQIYIYIIHPLRRPINPNHANLFFLLSSDHVVRGSRPGKQVQLGESEIRFLCLKAREIFMSQPILLELEAPIKICGECCFATLSQLAQHQKRCVPWYSLINAILMISILFSLAIFLLPSYLDHPLSFII